MKAKRLLIPFAILLIFALVAQGGLAVLPQARAQAAPGDNPIVFLPFLGGSFPRTATIFGITTGNLSNAQTLADTKTANPTWLRQDSLDWSKIQPLKNDPYNWSSVAAAEANMIQASQLGYRMIQSVTNVPGWAQEYKGSVCGPIVESEFDSFGNFLKAAVLRYSVPPYNVHYWEIGNEPDAPISYSGYPYGCWGDGSKPYYGGEYYGKMLATVIPYIKQADPNAKILNGGLLLDCDPSISTCGAPDMASFLEGMIQAGAVSQLDYVNFHAYDYQGNTLGVFGNTYHWNSSYQTGPVLVAKTAFVRNVLNQHNLGSKPLMNTEVSVLMNGDTCDDLCQQNKALYVGRAYAAAIAQGLAANIWYQADNSWNNSGLYGGPMYNAFVFARNELGNASMTRPITDYDSSYNVAGYEFDRGDILVWVLWSHDLAIHNIFLPGIPKAIYTWTLNVGPYTAIPPSASLDVGVFPVYVEWSK